VKNKKITIKQNDFFEEERIDANINKGNENIKEVKLNYDSKIVDEVLTRNFKKIIYTVKDRLRTLCKKKRTPAKKR